MPPTRGNDRGGAAAQVFRFVMRVERHARNVESWRPRVLSAVLVGVLAGSPAIASVCAAVCFEGSQSVGRSGVPLGASHHAAALAEAPRAEAQRDIAEHGHHQSAATAATPSRDLPAPVLGSVQCVDCCSDVESRDPPLSAARADGGLLSAPCTTGPAPQLTRMGPRSAARALHDEAPPGLTALDCAPFVLRI